ncbi:MAG: class I SAM-dependent methyltransferase, partial [Deltaproteobacteria bacterium]|nr:class I SAM-dependent methyltransferase [Deltaproteobacteria bacterium]
TVACGGCRESYPVLGGVLVLVPDVRGYLAEHAKGISRYVDDAEIPKAHRATYLKAKKQLNGDEHIEEDLEAERVTALYVMTHYLKAAEVRSPSPAIAELVAKHWDRGPFARIRELLDAKKAGGSLVELGCGVGGLLPALGPRVKSYLGLDSSFASIAIARHFALGAPLKREVRLPADLLDGPVSRPTRIAPPRKAQAGADFVVCELDRPPLKSGCWDVAAALNVIDMLPEPADLPALQRRLLVEGGLAVQSCPYIWHARVAAELRARLPKRIRDSAAAVEWLYEEAGFEVETSEAHVPWVFFKNERQVELYSTHLFLARKSR